MTRAHAELSISLLLLGLRLSALPPPNSLSPGALTVLAEARHEVELALANMVGGLDLCRLVSPLSFPGLA
jgi:hypothetical protein